ncbi:Dynein intermediate chain 2, axonemal [Papilio machaon]|uniref:Dynein intermediate chain 2, axonemal n=1 Tax=Papilio machaon TaxID=76193 RepID=A0A194QXZ9_PAPMA|nr:Dynein intermediate chain 2, axonemal [Papilio machaon]
MDINYQYSKKRGDFGRQPLFCEQGPQLCDSIAPDLAERRRYILRNPVHQFTQNTPSFSQHTINTIRAEYTNSGANHAEGGWPKDVNVTDPEATQRYRRKIEKDDNYIHCVMALSPGMEHYVLQNNAIDMYRSYYAEMAEAPPLERSSVRIVNICRETTHPPRRVRAICWHPDGGHQLAASYTYIDWDRRPLAPVHSLLWDTTSPQEPLLSVAAAGDAIMDMAYAPRAPHMLAAALLSGRVGVWDPRAGSAPVVLCPPHIAHRDMARRLLFIHSKSGQEFFSSGPDGVCKWWDMRNLNEVTDELIIDMVKSPTEPQNMATAFGASALEYEATIPSRFMVGTENGLIIGGNRKGKTAYEKLPARFDAHLGPVWSLERNPGFLKNFLSVGDWTARVWSEDCRESAILWTPPARHRYTAGAWSPTRLSLMLLVQFNGVLTCWDLLRRQQRPVLSAQLCPEPLLSIRMHETGTLAACGSQLGNIYVVEMSHNLAQTDKNDKALLTAMFERESKRERILESRLRELRLKQRQPAAGGASALALTTPAADLAAVTAQYAQTVRRELANL